MRGVAEFNLDSLWNIGFPLIPKLRLVNVYAFLMTPSFPSTWISNIFIEFIRTLE